MKVGGTLFIQDIRPAAWLEKAAMVPFLGEKEVSFGDNEWNAAVILFSKNFIGDKAIHYISHLEQLVSERRKYFGRHRLFCHLCSKTIRESKLNCVPIFCWGCHMTHASPGEIREFGYSKLVTMNKFNKYLTTASRRLLKELNNDKNQNT